MSSVRRLAETVGAVAVMAVVVAGVYGLVSATIALRPAPPDDGLRREPPATIGARVETPHGFGVITAEVRYWDGHLWRVRLDSGRYVVLCRAQMVVLRGD